MNVKMVVVMRTKFPDGKGGYFGMRLGKSLVQASHATSMFLIRKLEKARQFGYEWSPIERIWLDTGMTKICVRVETEEELLNVHQQAVESNLEVHLITDLGRTEFQVPTRTCLAIGPAISEDIDRITGDLKLL